MAIFLVLGYMMLTGLVNKRRAIVSPGRVEVGFGPLPGAGGPSVATDADVTDWYYRYVVVPGRYGATRFYAAGVRRSNGEWLDVLAPFETEEQARQAATEAAVVFGRGSPLPVHAAQGLPAKRNWRAVLILFGWAGAVIAALLLGIWMELARHAAG